MQEKELFIKAALGYDAGINSGDHKKANKFHKELMKLKATMDSEKIEHLCLDLLNDDNDSIRLWAATFMFDVNIDTATKVLSELANRNCIAGLTAKLLLDAKQKGLV